MIRTQFNLDQSLQNLRNLAEKSEYKDGYHLGLNSKDFDKYDLAIEKEFGEMIYASVLTVKPDKILELGTANGYSTCWFLLGLIKNGKGELITIDSMDRRPKIWEILDIPSTRMTLFYKNTKDFAKTFQEKVDMVLFDTEHRIESVIGDIVMVQPFLNRGAALFIHDTFANPDMGKQLKDYLEGTNKYSYTSIDKSCGMGLATYLGETNAGDG